MLLGSESPLAQTYDVALLDLDGVCFAGDARVEHAADGVNGARAGGMRLSFVTNNASRAPQTVVDKLARNDIHAAASRRPSPPRASRSSPPPMTGPPPSCRAGTRPWTGR